MKIILFSHTHWDREWYRPFEVFRYKLVKVIDKVIDLLEKNEYQNFILDGQNIILEDYFEIKPNLKNKLKKLIKSNLLTIGPWYVLPDEFLITGEALITNLLFGFKLSKEFRGENKIAYLPDMFGHIAQMPQIIKGFNLKYALVWRGVSPKKSLFYWKGIDNTKILTIYLPLGYYNTSLAKYEPNFNELKEQIKRLKKFSINNVILLPNGGDHLEPVFNLKKLIKTANKVIKPHTLIQGTFEDFINQIKEYIKNSDIETIQGELRDSNRAYILPGVISSRIYLKLYNYKISNLLEKILQPLCTYNYLLNNEYHQEFVQLCWKYLLQNQPHDSICGCSIDQVHKEMLVRYDKSLQIINELINEAKNKISEFFYIHQLKLSNNNDYLFIYNMSPFTFNGILEVNLDFSLDNYPNGFEILDKNKKVEFEIIDKIKVKKFYSDINVLPDWKEVYSYKLLINLKDIPPLGIKVYTIKNKKNAERNLALIQNTNLQTIENEYLCISVNSDGSLKIIDKLNSQIYNNCNLFIDTGDSGDEYNYSPPINDKVIYPQLIDSKIILNTKLRQILEINLKMSLPKSLNQDRTKRLDNTVDCFIKVNVILDKEAKFIKFKTLINNLAQDHRLRVIFPFKKGNIKCYADSQFCILKRNIKFSKKVSQVKKGKEYKETTFPFQSFINLSSDKKGLMVITKGLHEGEIIKYNNLPSIAITLIRSVGWLSRDDLITRGGGAGPSFQTPEAQCIGEFEFEYTLLPHSNLSLIELAKYSCILNTDILYNQYSLEPVYKDLIFNHSKKQYNLSVFRDDVEYCFRRNEISTLYLYNINSLVKFEPENIILSTLKLSEDKKGVILRIYNPTDKTISSKLKINFKFTECYIVNLKEEKIKKQKFDTQNIIKLKLKPYKILTFKFL